jgi:hypothetical protein
MWLPKNERLLLAHYYRSIQAADREEKFKESELTSELKKRPQALADKGQLVQVYEEMQANLPRIRGANDLLVGRKMILLNRQDNPDVVSIALTIEGYDLGRQYCSRWEKSGLWFEAHRNHWIMVIISVLSGGLSGVPGSLLVQWMSHGHGHR